MASSGFNSISKPDIGLQDLYPSCNLYMRIPGNSNEGGLDGPSLSLTDDYEPIEKPPNFRKIDFLPLVLRPWVLSTALIFFAACLSGLMVLVVLSSTQPERLHGRQAVYKTFMPLIPSIAGAVTNVWWSAIFQTYLRIVPYQAMASANNNHDSKGKARCLNLQALGRFNWNFAHYWVVSCCCVTVNLVGLFLAPAKASLLLLQPTVTGWIIVPSHTLAFMCMAVYLMLIFSTAMIMIEFYQKPSGLRWDPGCLASQISLLTFFDSNGILEGLEFGQWRRGWGFLLEPFPKETEITNYGVFRLGYWKHTRSGYIVYGIRMLKDWSASEDSQIFHDRSLSPTQTTQKLRPFTVETPNAIHTQTQFSTEGLSGNNSKQRVPSLYKADDAPVDDNGHIVHEPELKAFGDMPFPIRDRPILLFWLSSVILLILWVTVMVRYDLHKPMELAVMITWWGRRQTVITFFLVFFLNCFQFFISTAARTYRLMEPIRSLKEPQSGFQGLLLDYVSTNVVTTIYHALSNHHWRVAWFTFLATFAQITPIMAGRILRQSETGTTDGRSEFLIDPFYFYCTFGLTMLLCVSLLFTRLPAPYCAPHYLYTALDLYPYIYHSGLAQYPEFVTGSPEDQEEDLKAQVRLARRQYYFGLYCCDGHRRHIGIASSQRLVDRIVVKRGWLHFDYRFRYRPSIQPFPRNKRIPPAPHYDADPSRDPVEECRTRGNLARATSIDCITLVDAQDLEIDDTGSDE